ncbi:MAG: MBL fold metallo-hydrolase [Candidatus Omnitrophica bacterium]|nr:MBL fold metallo-hydrolase [Candidatus Omnitrophota bacterium]
MKITFLGAAENVTGSRFLVESGKSRILIDCGLYQEREFRTRNWEAFPVEPAGIDNVILTHAHLDHCGYLPRLARKGFKGKIFCTPPTTGIAQISLLDSAKIQEEDAKFKRKRHRREGRKGAYPEVPLYTIDDAKNAFSYFENVPYQKQIQISSDIKATFYDAGHILGAAMIELKIAEDGKEKRCIFSGDIGRWNRPILCDPTVFAKADYVFMESTYGNRLHEEKEVPVEKLQRVIVETKEAGGNVVIPTFAIERAQELLFYISKLLREDKIAHLIVFVNSPMAINVTEVFKEYSDYFDKEAKALMGRGDSPFEFPLLKTTRSVAESKAINHIKGTSIIMAGSGMCTGGRIKHHLVKNITRQESTILFVGYQAKGTLGRTILERPESVRILGQVYPVRARIEKINGLSAHADRDELLNWVSGFKRAPEKIFVVHGEKEAAADFASTLRDKFKSEIIVPQYPQEYSI